MEKIYYDIENPAGFSSVSRLKQATKTGRSKVESFLQNQKVYQKHRREQRRFKRASLSTRGLGLNFHADLFDISRYSKFNRGYKFFIVFVDTFSQLLSARLMKNKTSLESARVLEEILVSLEKQNRKAIYSSCGTDLGKSFVSNFNNVICLQVMNFSTERSKQSLINTM
jgi:hypothetical protein